MPVSKRIAKFVSIDPSGSSHLVLTPVEEHGGTLVKRDDLADECGVKGGKARTLGVICRHIREAGHRGLTIYAARNSVTPATLGAVCFAYGIPACVHTAAAKEPLSQAFEDAKRNGVRVFEHRPGYMSVLAARAREQAEADGYMLVGLGLDYPPAVLETAKQCRNLPLDIKRLVTAVGSGHMLEGIVRGIEEIGLDISIFGVCVGKIPDLSPFEKSKLDVELITSRLDFSKGVRENKLGNLEVNPYYEAKCLEYLKPSDLFWVVAR